MYDPEITIVLLCCRAYLQTGTISDLKTYINTHTVQWEQVYNLCARHRVRPVALYVLSRVQEVLPAGVLQRFRTYCREAALFTFDRKIEAERLFRKLKNDGVDARIYKGMDLSQLLYADLSMREFTDTDVIIREDDVIKVMTILKEEGYKMHLEDYFMNHPQHFRQYNKDLTFGKSCAKGRWFGFEFHYRPTKTLMEVSYQFDELLHENYLSGRPLSAEEYYKLMLVNHGAGDFYPSLRALMDMVLLYRQGPFVVPAPLQRFEYLWQSLAASLLAFSNGTSVPIHDSTYRLLIRRLLHDKPSFKFSFLFQASVNILFGEGIRAKATAFLRHLHFLLRPGGHDLSMAHVPYFLLYFTKPFRLTYNAWKRKS